MRRKRYNLKQSVSLAIRPDLLARIDRCAEEQDVSRSQLVEKALQMFLLMKERDGQTENPRGDRATV